MLATAKASFTPLTQNATLAMMLQTNCSDIPGVNDLIPAGYEIDRTSTGLNATSCEIANQIRRSLALGNSLLSTNNLADVGSTRGKSAFFERQQPNTVGKARCQSAVRLGSRPGNTTHVGNRTRPHFEQMGKQLGYGEGAYPMVNNYSTIIPRKGAYANLHETQ